MARRARRGKLLGVIMFVLVRVGSWLKIASLAFLVLLGTAGLHAQTATQIEEILGMQNVNYERAAWLVLEAADLSGPLEASGMERAFDLARDNGWLPRNARSEDKATLEGVSLLIMRSFNIKGGLFYSLFKNPHYAYRELVYREIIQGRVDPQMAVSGEMLLFIINRVLEGTEEK